MLLGLQAAGAIAEPVHTRAFDDADPLFQSNDTLELRIAAPLDTLMRDRPDEEDLEGEASWAAADGTAVTVKVKLRTRGNYRRQPDICPFAPVRLDFKKSDVQDTLFDGQDKLKLVTHCKTGSRRSAQFLLREYLVYRMFNTLSDLSFRVRLLKLTWENTEDDGKSFEAPAFLIESEDRLARRIDLPPAAIPEGDIDALDPDYTNLTSLFHYFVGNTDYSPIAGPQGEDCCHNSTLFGSVDTALYPVPYDFDMSGMVNADYASPNPKFGIRDVKTRLYRGRCPFNDRLPSSIAAFDGQRASLFALLETLDGLSGWSQRDMNGFMEAFYETVSDPAQVEKQITAKCVP